MSETEEMRPVGDADDSEADEVAGVAEAERAFEELPDGSGCAEIWTHLSERRRRD